MTLTGSAATRERHPRRDCQRRTAPAPGARAAHRYIARLLILQPAATSQSVLLDSRLVASQNPCPSSTNALIEVARRLRNTNKHPENGSALSLARHNSAQESMPLRKSTASTATRIRICGVICSMPRGSQTRESTSPVRWLQCPSTPSAASHLAAIVLPQGGWSLRRSWR